MSRKIHQYYVYIVSNRRHGTLYIGVTNDIKRRMYEHKNKLVKGCTQRYNLDKLVYFEAYQYIDKAIKREKQLKNWNRAWKIELIESKNKEWQDLATNWSDEKMLRQAQHEIDV